MARTSIVISILFLSSFIFATNHSLVWAGKVAAVTDEERVIRFSTGVDYSSGDYGESSDTDILYIPFTARYEWDRWTAKGTLPYLRIRSGGGVIGGGSGTIVVEDPVTEERTTESGVGDLVASLSYFAYYGSETMPMLDVTGKVKLPTADEDKGLGTGETDFSLEVDLTKAYGSNVAFGTVGYRKFGDPPGFDLNNVLYLSIGGQRKLDENYNGGLIYDWREATTDTNDETSEVTLYLSRKTSGRFRFLGYGVFGLSDGSPDFALGLTVSTDARVDDLTVKNLQRLLPWHRENE